MDKQTLTLLAAGQQMRSMVQALLASQNHPDVRACLTDAVATWDTAICMMVELPDTKPKPQPAAQSAPQPAAKPVLGNIPVPPSRQDDLVIPGGRIYIPEGMPRTPLPNGQVLQ